MRSDAARKVAEEVVHNGRVLDELGRQIQQAVIRETADKHEQLLAATRQVHRLSEVFRHKAEVTEGFCKVCGMAEGHGIHMPPGPPNPPQLSGE